MKDRCRIVVVGDAGVGKTSIIGTLVREEFPEEVEEVMLPTTVSPEIALEKIPLTLVDTSSKAESMGSVIEQINSADVIIVVYSVDRPDSLQRAVSYWLRQALRHLNGSKPVILVGNKIDTRDDDTLTNGNQDLEQEIVPIMNEFRELETCIECSAKGVQNIMELFYFATRAVVHPTAPLYNTRDHALTVLGRKALERAFKMCDKDRNGFLNDEELKAFQRHCFHVDLSDQELDGVKRVVSEACQDGVDPVKGLAMPGFIYLHTLFVERGRVETTWTVVRKFGYDDTLHLENVDTSILRSKAGEQAVELNRQGRVFLKEMFDEYDVDKDGALSPAEYQAFFSRHADGAPWSEEEVRNMVPTGESNYITFDQVFLLFSMSLLQAPAAAMTSLAYLGYAGESVHELVSVTGRRSLERVRRKINRNTLLCYVFGAPGSGKSSLLQALIGNTSAISKDVVSTVASVAIDEGSEKVLVARKFTDCRAVLMDKDQMDACDIVCLVYDASDPESFQYIADVQKRIQDMAKPCVYIAAKADLNPVKQNFEIQPQEFCAHMALPPPEYVNLQGGLKLSADSAPVPIANLFRILASVALNPQLSNRLAGEDEKSTVGTALKWVAGLSLVGVLGYGGLCAYRLYAAKDGGTTPLPSSSKPSSVTTTQPQ